MQLRPAAIACAMLQLATEDFELDNWPPNGYDVYEGTSSKVVGGHESPPTQTVPYHLNEKRNFWPFWPSAVPILKIFGCASSRPLLQLRFADGNDNVPVACCAEPRGC